MVAPRVTYQIRVRDFRWRGGLRVQSPNIGRESDSARVIFRPLEGINLDEPRFTEGFAELQDDPDSGIYDADAHGVVVSDTSETHLCPVWVPVEHGAGKNADDEVCVVNLRTFRSSVVPIAKVCWVPGRRGPDGRLYTRIGSPYRSMGRNRAHLLTLVAVQIEGHPMETKIEVVASSELAEYSVIDEIQKELIFDRQYLVLHGFCQPGSADLRWRRLREDYLGTQEEDLLHLSEPSSDEDPAVDEMADVPPGPNNVSQTQYGSLSLVWGHALTRPQQVYSCQCRWPDLRPTLRNPCPLHRHNTDADCRLGSDHSTHCVFADQYVIWSSLCSFPAWHECPETPERRPGQLRSRLDPTSR
ncbi:hypothetical protein GGR56DRAFT_435485 [Xylariaceae sp. FL0804]|nr:hypothetical protein GGR56DRAFT_435485 [Xylariaceae sp. FL0804]